jgi:hypothetical protein
MAYREKGWYKSTPYLFGALRASNRKIQIFDSFHFLLDNFLESVVSENGLLWRGVAAGKNAGYVERDAALRRVRAFGR